MNKKKLVNEIIAALARSGALLEKAARASHAEATHESSRAESKYDTRGLEAAYLAGGQARQARETLDAIQACEALELRAFGPKDPIGLSALVELEIDHHRFFFFLGPKGGGIEVDHAKTEVTVITPDSPIGLNLMGKTVGQTWFAKIGTSQVKYRVISVA
jgi:hypothetical protein